MKPSKEARELATWIERHHVSVEDTAAEIDAFAARKVAAERERCALLLEQVTKDDDTSELGEAAADAYNAGPARRSCSDRLRDWNSVLAVAIRSGSQP